jgi:hypothetical protein
MIQEDGAFRLMTGLAKVICIEQIASFIHSCFQGGPQWVQRGLDVEVLCAIFQTFHSSVWPSESSTLSELEHAGYKTLVIAFTKVVKSVMRYALPYQGVFRRVRRNFWIITRH